MQRSLCQLSTAILLAACLLLQSVQCQPVADQSGYSPSAALENYLSLRALLLPNTLPENFYDEMLGYDMGEYTKRRTINAAFISSNTSLVSETLTPMFKQHMDIYFTFNSLI